MKNDRRHRAREAALQILYQWEIGQTDVDRASETFFELQWPDAGAAARGAADVRDRAGARHRAAPAGDRSRSSPRRRALAARADGGHRSPDPAHGGLRAAARPRHAAARSSSTRRSSWRGRSAPRTRSSSSTACWTASGRRWNEQPRRTRPVELCPLRTNRLQQRRSNLERARAARRRRLPAPVRSPAHGRRAGRGARRARATTSSKPSGPRRSRAAASWRSARSARRTSSCISDGRARIQVYIRQDSLPALDFQIFKLLDFGDWVGVEGRLFRTKTNELTIWASRLHFLAKCLLPLPEKWHGLTDVEIRYRQRYLDLIVNPDSRRVFETRSRVVVGDPRVHDRARLPRGRDADDAADRRRRARAAVRDASQRARHGALPARSRRSCT